MLSKILATLALAATTAYAGSASYVKGEYEDVNAMWIGTEPTKNAACSNVSDSEQSPINLTDGQASTDLGLNLFIEKYTNEASAIYTKGSNVQASISGGEMELTFNGGGTDMFTVVQTHVHAPSEHTVDGKFYDMEMHFVHKYSENSPNGDARYGAVIGVFFDIVEGGDQENSFIEQFIQYGGLHQNQRTTGPLFAKNFLDRIDTSEFWSYDGSLTTPPCSEKIKWSVLKEVQPITERQLQYFNNLWMNDPSFTDVEGMGNNRPVQPLNQRTIYSRYKPFFVDHEYFYATIVLSVLLAVAMFAFMISCICQCCCGKCQKKSD